MTKARIINHHGNVEEVSAPAFTPGPWEATPQDVLNADIYPLTIRSEEWAVAEIYGDVAHISAKANARLIAAAPELYEALETAAKRFRDYEQIHRLKGTEEGYLKADNNGDLAIYCEAALAKARGEQ